MSKKKPATLIYCGPTLNGLPQYSTYIGELPTNAKKHYDKSQAVQELFIKVDELASTKQKVKKVGTRENLFYKKALDYAAKGE
ncbi:hypothetical protein [Lentibacillus sp. Marseille-P4043]|uniref:hypothetical protein n=1 Tax=Lentibacillus sp. Marseille-P4043 TaxID=2040293 RepID=UPI000D0B17A5|nr:hypothetical protein [Lentibacillus sp. Marseille-P4043]